MKAGATSRTVAVKLHICLNEALYYFAFTLWYAFEIVFNTSIKTFFGIDVFALGGFISWLVFALLMIQILFLQKYEPKTLLIICLITFFMALSVLLSGNRQIFAMWMFAVAAKEISFERVVRIAKALLILGFSIILPLYFLGILEDVVLYSHGTFRHTLGFIHPNLLGMRVFQLVLCVIYTHRDQIRFRDYVLIISAVCFCWIFPNSKTPTVALMILFVMLLLYKRMESGRKKRGVAFSSFMITGAVSANMISIALSLVDISKNSVFLLLDKAAQNRFAWGHLVYGIFGVSVFGQRIRLASTEERIAGMSNDLFLDNAYFHILLEYGIVTFIIFSTLYITGMSYFKQKGERMMILILFMYSVYGIMETGMFLLQHNVFLISLGAVLFHRLYAREGCVQ
ncbi:MAG: hypothetical protein K5696_04500 [Lachnospiraceae bacterium]|nr:hypothetical protein [Lachnospiraceae bacterium]